MANNVYEINIIQTSKSGKSIIINMGEVEGIKNGEIAHIFYKRVEKGLTRPKYFYVAQGEAINAKSSQSYWYLTKIRRHYFIKENSKLVFIFKGRDPRRPYLSRHTDKVLLDGIKLEEINENGMPKDLMFEDEENFKTEELIGTNVRKKQDLETEKLTSWKEYGAAEWDEHLETSRKNMRAINLSRKVDYEKIKKKRNQAVFNSTALNAISKVNGEKYGLESLYGKNVGSSSLGDVQKKSIHQSVYDLHLEKQKENDGVSSQAKHLLKEKGALFSKKMSDEELREYFIVNGIEKELHRQYRALTESIDHEFQFFYNNNLTNHTSTADSNFQNTNYSMSLGYELYLLRTRDSLRNYSVTTELEMGVGNYDLKNINGRFSEGSFNIFLNWYFFNPPTAIKKYMPYLSLGYKRGRADAYSESLTKDYEYEYSSFPSLRFGIKYRFKEGDTARDYTKFGMGLSFLTQYDRINYSTSSVVQDDIYSSFSTNQLKVGLGLNFYF